MESSAHPSDAVPSAPPRTPAPREEPTPPRPRPVRAGWRTWLDLIYPPVCVQCGGLCEDSPLRYVCARCAPLIVQVGPPHCTTCGHPFFGIVEGERICPHCDRLAPAYREARTATLFKGPARELVLTLKYHRGHHVLEDIGRIVRANNHVRGFIRGATLVPVPLHPRKQRERGYNQSELLAQIFVDAVDGTAQIQPLLCRTQDTESQTAFDRDGRRERMKNAFAPARGADITPGLRYILVDDVFTTGSTLNACARVLRRAGCLNLDVVTFGHG